MRHASDATRQRAEGRKPASERSSQRSRQASTATTDHREIREWAEERGGKPACVKGTGGKEDSGIIRIEFPGAPRRKEKSLQEITWDEFFDRFDERGLALVYQKTTAGGARSHFNKIVSRESAGAPSHKRGMARAAGA